MVIEPVNIGIMFKNGPRFAELRTIKKWVALTKEANLIAFDHLTGGQTRKFRGWG